MRQRAALVIVGILYAIGCDAPEESDGGLTVIPDAGPLAPCSPEPCVFDAFELLTDPYLPARVLPGRMHLASSRQPEPPEGAGNDDHDNYLRIDGARRILMEAEGPGVITRLWFTGREPATQDYTVLDRTVLHAEIDGEEVVWAPGQSGISLATLTSGTLPSFPRPWVAGRDTASNGFIVSVPIAFAESIRLWIDEPPGVDTFVYYQIDWRELPPATMRVESFDGALTGDQSMALEAATDVWIERSSAAMEATSDERAIAPGETAAFALDEPTTVRALSVAMLEGELDALEATLYVDAEPVVAGPLVSWAFAAPPTEPSDSALATVAADAVAFRYPFPVHGSAELRLRNLGAARVSARVTFEHDPGAPDADLGGLRASCGTSLTPAVDQNLSLLDLRDRRGHYAGQFLIVRSESFWVLEGDHELLADGAHLLGTGLEDYFGGAFYYLRGAFAHPLSGASGRSVTGGVGVISQYRHHLLGTVPFERRFRFDYETFFEGARFEHCLFWYEAP